MATYATQANLEGRFESAAVLANLTSASGSTPDATVVGEILDGAEGETNSYLASRLAVPVDLSAHSDSAAFLRSLVLDLAVYAAHLRRPPVPEEVLTARNSRVEWLVRFAKGEVALPAETAPEPTVQDEPSGTYAFARESSGPEDMI